MADNNNNRQNSYKYNRESKLNYHWGPDDEIMRIMNRRDNSPETRKRARWKENRINKTWARALPVAQKAGQRNFLPGRPDDGDWKEIKRIDIRPRRKVECRDTHLGGADISTISVMKSTGTGNFHRN